MVVLHLSSIIMHPVGFASLHQTSAQAEAHGTDHVQWFFCMRLSWLGGLRFRSRGAKNIPENSDKLP